MSHHTVREWIAAHNPNKQLTQVGAGYHCCDGNDNNNSVARAIELGFNLIPIKKHYYA